jgi:hypothetical protein
MDVAAPCSTLSEPGLLLELHCIGISHYCMRAKWALQLAGLPFTSVHYLPLAHVMGIKRLQVRSSSSLLQCSSRSMVAAEAVEAISHCCSQ